MEIRILFLESFRERKTGFTLASQTRHYDTVMGYQFLAVIVTGIVAVGSVLVHSRNITPTSFLVVVWNYFIHMIDKLTSMTFFAPSQPRSAKEMS